MRFCLFIVQLTVL